VGCPGPHVCSGRGVCQEAEPNGLPQCVCTAGFGGEICNLILPPPRPSCAPTTLQAPGGGSPVNLPHLEEGSVFTFDCTASNRSGYVRFVCKAGSAEGELSWRIEPPQQYSTAGLECSLACPAKQAIVDDVPGLYRRWNPITVSVPAGTKAGDEFVINCSSVRAEILDDRFQIRSGYFLKGHRTLRCSYDPSRSGFSWLLMEDTCELQKCQAMAGEGDGLAARLVKVQVDETGPIGRQLAVPCPAGDAIPSIEVRCGYETPHAWLAGLACRRVRFAL